MDTINKLELYLEYLNFFFHNYLLWAVIAIVMLVIILNKYNKAHPFDKQKSKMFVFSSSIATIILLVFFMINSVKQVDTSHNQIIEFPALSY